MRLKNNLAIALALSAAFSAKAIDNPLIKVSTNDTEMVMSVADNGNLVHNYYGKKFKNAEPYKTKKYGLPAPNLSSTYIFATNEDFFSYPNNYNYYVQYYTGTFQHGGISLQEMLVPLVTLTPKG